MLYTYINRHAGTPDKNKNKNIVQADPAKTGTTQRNGISHTVFTNFGLKF